MTFNAGQRVKSSYLNQAVQLISTTKLSTSQPSIVSPTITGFTHVRVLWQARTTSGNLSDTLEVRFNGDTSSAYGWQRSEGAGTTAQASWAALGTATFIAAGAAAGGGAAAGYFGGGNFDVIGFGQAGTGHQATLIGNGFVIAGTGVGQSITGSYGGVYTPSATLTTITLLPAAGSFAAGTSVSFYGYN